MQSLSHQLPATEAGSLRTMLLQAAAGSRKLANHTDPRTQGGDRAEAYRFDPAADPRFVAFMAKVHHHHDA